MDFPSSELMRDPAVVEKMDWWWKNKPTFEQTDADAYMLESQPDPVKYMDSLYDQDSDSWYRIQDTLQFMPAQSVYRALGKRMLYWTVGNAHHPQPFNELYWDVAEITGIEPDLLKQTISWMQYFTNENEGQRFLAQIGLAETYKSSIDQIDLAKHLQSATKESVELSESRKASYALTPLESRGGMGDGQELNWYSGPNPGEISYRVWLDTPVGFGLIYKDRLQAVAGIAASSPDELMIYQLQGITPYRVNLDKQTGKLVRGEKVRPRGLMPLDWRRLMVNITGQLALQANAEFTSIGIQSAKNNKWVTMHEPRMSHAEAELRYDIPAIEMGFAEGDDQNWHKPISELFPQ